MASSNRVTNLLDVAIAKAVCLSPREQDEIARQILGKFADGEVGSPYFSTGTRFSTIKHRLSFLLPVNDVARSIVLIFLGWTIFVMFPMAILTGVAEIVHMTNSWSGGSAQIRQTAVGGSNSVRIGSVKPATPAVPQASGDPGAATDSP